MARFPLLLACCRREPVLVNRLDMGRTGNGVDILVLDLAQILLDEPGVVHAAPVTQEYPLALDLFIREIQARQESTFSHVTGTQERPYLFAVKLRGLKSALRLILDRRNLLSRHLFPEKFSLGDPNSLGFALPSRFLPRLEFPGL